MSLTLDTSEVRALALRVGTAGLRIGAKSAAVLRRTALSIEADAKVLAPNVTGYTPSGAISDSTGDLRNSITTTVTGDGRTGRMSAEIGPTVEYGLFQEIGTSTMAPQPYMGPAFDRRAPGYELALAQVAEQELL